MSIDSIKVTQTWYDRTVLSNSKGEKIDLVMCSYNDFDEVVAEAKQNVPPFVFEKMEYHLPNVIHYANTTFVRNSMIKDAEPKIYKQIEL